MKFHLLDFLGWRCFLCFHILVLAGLPLAILSIPPAEYA